MRTRPSLLAMLLTTLPAVACAAGPATAPAIPYYGFGYRPPIPTPTVSPGLLPAGNDQPANPDPDPYLNLDPHKCMRPPGQNGLYDDPPPLYRNYIAPRWRNYNVQPAGNTMRGGGGNSMRPTFPNTMQPTTHPAGTVQSMTPRPVSGNAIKPAR